MDTTVNFEADKARIARAILNIDNREVLEKVKRSFYQIFDLRNREPAADVTAQMIERFSGAWTDNRTADEIINDIYNSRRSAGDNHKNPFDE